MMRIFYSSVYFLVLILMVPACKSKESGMLHVGDIEFDPSTDNPDFKICGPRIFQYYNFEKGNFSLDKKLIRKHFADRFKKGGEGAGQTGYITIRFVVNCQGEADRYRIYEIDRELIETKFDKALKNQILALTKELKGWKPGEFQVLRNRPGKFDFYQYLTFKIHEGELIDILP